MRQIGVVSPICFCWGLHMNVGKTLFAQIMDFVPWTRLYQMHQAGAFFVTRAKRGMNARRVYSARIDRTTGVICDQRIMLNGFYTSKHYPEHLRRIRFKDPETGKTLVFLTNNTTLFALTIAALYKSRWQVELLFKWIKQHDMARLFRTKNHATFRLACS